MKNNRLQKKEDIELGQALTDQKRYDFEHS
jgi:hypothetical protein